jgi:hypothetical protein
MATKELQLSKGFLPTILILCSILLFLFAMTQVELVMPASIILLVGLAFIKNWWERFVIFNTITIVLTLFTAVFMWIINMNEPGEYVDILVFFVPPVTAFFVIPLAITNIIYFSLHLKKHKSNTKKTISYIIIFISAVSLISALYFLYYSFSLHLERLPI